MENIKKETMTYQQRGNGSWSIQGIVSERKKQKMRVY